MRRASLVLLFIASAAWAEGNPGIASYVDGIDAIEQLRYADAVASLTKAIEAEGQNPDYYTARGVAYALSEHITEAQGDLQRSLKLRPQDDETRMWMASTVAMQGEFSMDTQYFPAATRDPYESFVRKWTKEYGAPNFSAQQNGGKPTRVAQMKRTVALAYFPEIARQFAARRKAQPMMGPALLERAKAIYGQQKYAEALVAIEPLLTRSPEDPEALSVHAGCLVHLGAPAHAREEYTRLLTWNTTDENFYLGRALAAARMGDARRMNADLDTLARLDAAIAEKSRQQDESVLGAFTEDKSPNAELFSAMEQASQAKWDDLVAKALQVRRAVDARRTRYAEAYQDRLATLARAFRAAPKDADRLTDIGEFLEEEADVLGERVEPRGPFHRYRYWTAERQELELAISGQLLDQALQVNPNHVRALAARAMLDIRRDQWAEALARLRKALDIGGDIPEVLELFMEVMEHEAAVKNAKANDLRSTQTWSTYEYFYWRYPSQADLDRADEYERQTEEMMKLAQKALEAALAACEGTARGFYMKALLLSLKGDLAGAKAALLESVRLDPKDFEAHRLLASIHAQLGEHAEGLSERMIATNLIETTAAPILGSVWGLIATTRFDSARKALREAATWDPADARIAAYLGVVAAAEGKSDEAVGWWRVALAQEEARARGRGKSLAPDAKGMLSADEMGFTLSLRRAMAGLLLKAGKMEEALAQFLDATKYESRVSQWEWANEVPTAMLPSAEKTQNDVAEGENLMAMLAWSRVEAGAALVALYRCAEAIEQLEPVEEISSDKMVNGVGLDKLRKAQVHAAMYLAKAYLAYGQLEEARKWVAIVPHKRIGAGPSLDPNAELEEEGTKLQDQIDRAWKAAQEKGDESKHGSSPPGANKVRAAFQKLADDIGLSSMPEQQDVADLEQRTRSAVEAILTPKSIEWRVNVLRVLWLVRIGPGGGKQRPEVATMQEKALTALESLAKASGYPEADLASDLALDPKDLERELDKKRRGSGQEAPPADAAEARLQRMCDEVGIRCHRQGDRLGAGAEDLLFLALQRGVQALMADSSQEGWKDSVVSTLTEVLQERQQYARQADALAKWDQGIAKLKALAVERGYPADDLDKALGAPGRRRYR